MSEDTEIRRIAPEDRRVRSTAFWLAVGAAICAGLVFSFAMFVVVARFTKWEEVLFKNFAAIVGLPGAAGLAFALVVFLRQTDGPVEFEGLGFKFKGAAGQVIMWILCFLSIAGAIKLCWSI